MSCSAWTGLGEVLIWVARVVYACCFRPQIGTEVTEFLAASTTAAAGEPGPGSRVGHCPTTHRSHDRRTLSTGRNAAALRLGCYEWNH